MWRCSSFFYLWKVNIPKLDAALWKVFKCRSNLDLRLILQNDSQVLTAAKITVKDSEMSKKWKKKKSRKVYSVFANMQYWPHLVIADIFLLLYSSFFASPSNSGQEYCYYNETSKLAKIIPLSAIREWHHCSCHILVLIQFIASVNTVESRYCSGLRLILCPGFGMKCVNQIQN